LVVASSGAVTARVTWREGDLGAIGLRIAIRRAGRLISTQLVPTSWGECRRDCVRVPRGGPGGGRPLVVRDFDGDREAEILLNLYGGGAHCCAISQAYSYDHDAGMYRGRRTTWEADYRLLDYDSDGVFEFTSADTRFCFGCSYPLLARPIRIWHLRRGRFVDATRSFPNVVASGARDQRRAVVAETHAPGAQRERVRLTRLYLGVYVADTCLLDRCLRGWRLAGALARRHDLGRGSSTYLKRLRRYLARLGYWR